MPPRSTKGMKKPGSGRTKGAVSLVTVSMGDLKKYFTQPEQRIVVSRKFIELFHMPYEMLENQNLPAVPATAEQKQAPTIKSRDFK